MAGPPGPTEFDPYDFDGAKHIDFIDSMLFNAYGAVYKHTIRIMKYEDLGFDQPKFTLTDEQLMVKGIVTNLSSVLDHCCYVLYCMHKNGNRQSFYKPKRFNFPYERYKLIYQSSQENKEWEENMLENLVGEQNTSKFYQAGLPLPFFLSVQIQNSAASDDQKIFQLLRFLRNTFTHQLICLWDDSTTAPKRVPKLLKPLDKQIKSIEIMVPKCPWRDMPRKENKCKFKCQLLLDVLYDSCDLVEKLRDRMLLPANFDSFRRNYDLKEITDENAWKVVHKRQEIEFGLLNGDLDYEAI